MKKIFSALLLLLATGAYAQNKTCSCFLLMEKNKNLSVEKVTIDNNNVQVLNDPAIVGPVFSLGEGLNGDMVQADRRGGMIIAQCKDNLLKLKFRSKSGDEKPLPDMNLAELKQMNIRLNVVSGDGGKRAFMIERYEKITDDNGPVIDMFGGRVPVKPGDFLITTETRKPAKSATITGKASYKMKNGWVIVPVTIGGGVPRDFVVDLAATSTVIDQQALPPATEIHKVEMTEYTANGANTKKASMQGATGNVQQDVFLGKATLTNTRIGNVKTGEINASVLRAFPARLREAGIAGIIGTDVLMRSESLSLEALNRGAGQISFDNTVVNGPRIAVPFTIAGGLLFVEGKLNGTPIRFVLDTGARETILSKAFAQENKLDLEVIPGNKTISGIDGQPSKVDVVKLSSFAIGGHSFDMGSVVLADIAALQAFGLDRGSALLGMDFFKKFRSVSLNFSKREINFVK